MSLPTRIVLLDRMDLIRQGLSTTLSQDPNFHVVGEARDVDQLVPLLEEYHPHLVIMDIDQEEGGGLDTISLIQKVSLHTRVIVLTMDTSPVTAIAAIKRGIAGYLLKEMDVYSVLNIIKVISDGHSYMHPKICTHVFKEIEQAHLPNKKVDAKLPAHILTQRECEILQLLADGKSNRQIAEVFFISEKTVKNHVSNLLQKIDCNDRTQAVIKAIKNNWVELH